MSEPTITKKELAAISLSGPWESTDLIPRLIAALRAKDQQIATLTARLESCERMRETSRLRAESLERERRVAVSEMDITEEELAVVVGTAESWSGSWVGETLARLVAALRAKDEQIETLGAQIDWLLRRLPEREQEDFDALAARKDARWDL